MKNSGGIILRKLIVGLVFAIFIAGNAQAAVIGQGLGWIQIQCEYNSTIMTSAPSDTILGQPPQSQSISCSDGGTKKYKYCMDGSNKVAYFAFCDGCTYGTKDYSFGWASSSMNSVYGAGTSVQFQGTGTTCQPAPSIPSCQGTGTGYRQCSTQSTTINGTLYCSTGSSCTAGFAIGGYLGSICCQDSGGMGIGGANCTQRCIGSTCNTGMTLNADLSNCICAKGYYGSPTSSTTGCTACSTLSLISGLTGIPTSGATTGSSGMTSATSCFIPAGTATDDPGTFSWGNCPYQ
ncbi:MAG: hypothetical protein LBJ18_02395 [Rickettsiales bacterium]|nr:hypothetical protein [Rickettsiales bacterium]